MRLWRGVPLLGVCICLAACAGSTQHDTYTAKCLVSPARAASGRVRLGGTVTLYATGFRCHPYFSGPQTLKITVFPNTHPDRTVSVASVDVGPSGAFRLAVRVPRYFRPGTALFRVTGPRLDQRWCPPNGDCKGDDVVVQTDPVGPGLPGPPIERVVDAPQFGSTYAGIVTEPGGVNYIYVKRGGLPAMASALSAAGIPASKYRLRPVAHSLGELTKLQGRITRDAPALRAMGIDIVQWGPDAASNTIVVKITKYTKDHAHALEARYGGPRWVTVGAWKGPLPRRVKLD